MSANKNKKTGGVRVRVVRFRWVRVRDRAGGECVILSEKRLQVNQNLMATLQINLLRSKLYNIILTSSSLLREILSG